MRKNQGAKAQKRGIAGPPIGPCCPSAPARRTPWPPRTAEALGCSCQHLSEGTMRFVLYTRYGFRGMRIERAWSMHFCVRSQIFSPHDRPISLAIKWVQCVPDPPSMHLLLLPEITASQSVVISADISLGQLIITSNNCHLVAVHSAKKHQTGISMSTRCCSELSRMLSYANSFDQC